jgi:hypothetical protein
MSMYGCLFFSPLSPTKLVLDYAFSFVSLCLCLVLKFQTSGVCVVYFVLLGFFTFLVRVVVSVIIPVSCL